MMSKKFIGITKILIGFLITITMTTACDNKEIDIKNKNTSIKSEAKDEVEKTIDYFEVGSELLQKESIGGLKLGMKEEELENILKNPISKSDSAIWGSDGLEHKTYSYDYAEIGLVKNKEGFIVCSIRAWKGFQGETLEKIGIGSKKEAVLEAYSEKVNPEGIQGQENIIVVGSIYSGIIFKLEDGKISEIFMGASAE